MTAAAHVPTTLIERLAGAAAPDLDPADRLPALTTIARALTDTGHWHVIVATLTHYTDHTSSNAYLDGPLTLAALLPDHNDRLHPLTQTARWHLEGERVSTDYLTNPAHWFTTDAVTLTSNLDDTLDTFFDDSPITEAIQITHLTELVPIGHNLYATLADTLDPDIRATIPTHPHTPPPPTYTNLPAVPARITPRLAGQHRPILTLNAAPLIDYLHTLLTHPLLNPDPSLLTDPDRTAAAHDRITPLTHTLTTLAVEHNEHPGPHDVLADLLNPATPDPNIAHIVAHHPDLAPHWENVPTITHQRLPWLGPGPNASTQTFRLLAEYVRVTGEPPYDIDIDALHLTVDQPAADTYVLATLPLRYAGTILTSPHHHYTPDIDPALAAGIAANPHTPDTVLTHLATDFADDPTITSLVTHRILNAATPHNTDDEP